MFGRTEKIAAVCCVAVGAAIGWYFAQPTTVQRAFVYVVRIKTKPGKRDEWLSEWAKLAKHCRNNEPKTLTYEASTSAGDDVDSIMIYERYPTKASLENPHRVSAPFLALKKFAHLVESASSEEFLETNLGYISR
eukprot:m.109533 g.109533  ORF g.109533 m.109533 type:complete len:135 (-) comp51770_c0_seq1:71-475(-)